jgi:2-C-methyl-D-erythritol 2,4-cyclodiphosphate synthase
MRAGIGFDAHAFDPSRPLVLGGVTIPDAPGLSGHSDADVVSHAIADALLGAANLGDLGAHFPGTDEWKDASSTTILARVANMLEDRRYRIASIDATVLLETPKLGSHAVAMCKAVAEALGIEAELVSVKATTTDGLGTVGRGEGAACMAIALVDET